MIPFSSGAAFASVSMAVLMAVAGIAAANDQQTVDIVSSKDNTLIETTDGSLSLGGASYFYVGRTGPAAGATLRRGVIAFDVAGAVPAGATVTDATLTLHVFMTVSGEQPTTLQRLLSDWGEGTSDAFGGGGAPSTENDATWLHTFYSGAFWSSPGGDFTETISATTGVAGSGQYTWQSAQLIADVQDFLDNPESNFGWIVRGNESDLHTAKQFSSRLHNDPQVRPTLSITYTLPVCADADLNCDGVVDVFDLIELINQWGPCADCTPGSCPADLTGDCMVDVFDLIELINNWG